MSKAKLTKVLVLYGSGGRNCQLHLHLVNTTTLREIEEKLNQMDHSGAAELAREEDAATDDDKAKHDWPSVNTIEYVIYSEEEAGPTMG